MNRSQYEMIKLDWINDINIDVIQSKILLNCIEYSKKKDSKILKRLSENLKKEEGLYSNIIETFGGSNYHFLIGANDFQKTDLIDTLFEKSRLNLLEFEKSIKIIRNLNLNILELLEVFQPYDKFVIDDGYLKTLYHENFSIVASNFEVLEFIKNSIGKPISSHKVPDNYPYDCNIDESILNQNSVIVNPDKEKRKSENEPKSFEDLFYNPADSEKCLDILKTLNIINGNNEYSADGKNGNIKGLIPLWIKILANHKPNPIIKPFSDSIYAKLLNEKIMNLNLTKDGNEFRKNYSSLDKYRKDIEIKVILSRFYQK